MADELTYNQRPERLKQAIAAASCSGTWQEIEHGHQFRAKNGAILNYYPSTGRVVFQGPRAKANALQIKLAPHLDIDGDSETAEVSEVRMEAGLEKRVFVVHGHDAESREQL